MNSTILKSHYPVIEENYFEFINRYHGFGKGLYYFIKENHPDIYNNLKFYKKKEHSAPDSFALLDKQEKTLAIQLDPECEMIIIWNDKIQLEFGTWEPLDYESIVKKILVIW